MEKDFATLFAETEAEMTPESSDNIESEETTEEIEPESNEETEEVESDESEEESSDSDSNDELDGEPEEPIKKSVEEKTFNKMAQMRVELKKAQTEKAASNELVNRFDSIAKKLQFKDINELLEKTEEKLIIQRAQETGKSVEDIKSDIERDKRIAELEEKLNEKDKAEIDNRYSGVVTDFVSNNKLSDTEIKRIEAELSDDGFTIEALKSMQPKPLKKLLDSYLKDSNSKQKELEEKVKLKKEIPLDQNSGNIDSEEDEVMKLYNQISRKE